MLSVFCFFFFFSSRRRHTRYIGDWSSDMCSSDLPGAGSPVPAASTTPSSPPPDGRSPGSEERRVGKECRARWTPYHSKKKKNKKSPRRRIITHHTTNYQTTHTHTQP